MAKTVLFGLLAPYADWEAAYLASALNMLAPGAFAVRTVSVSREPVASIGGFQVMPDFDAASVPDDYAALALIGGMGWRGGAARGFLPLAEDCFRQGKVLGGICDAAAFLARAGALNCVRHTANSLDDLKNLGGPAYAGEALFAAKQTVRDGNIVTANGTAPLEFAREMLLALEAAPEEKIRGWYDFHKLGFYTAPMPEM